MKSLLLVATCAILVSSDTRYNNLKIHNIWKFLTQLSQSDGPAQVSVRAGH